MTLLKVSQQTMICHNCYPHCHLFRPLPNYHLSNTFTDQNESNTARNYWNFYRSKCDVLTKKINKHFLKLNDLVIYLNDRGITLSYHLTFPD